MVALLGLAIGCVIASIGVFVVVAFDKRSLAVAAGFSLCGCVGFLVVVLVKMLGR